MGVRLYAFLKYIPSDARLAKEGVMVLSLVSYLKQSSLVVSSVIKNIYLGISLDLNRQVA